MLLMFYVNYNVLCVLSFMPLYLCTTVMHHVVVICCRTTHVPTDRHMLPMFSTFYQIKEQWTLNFFHDSLAGSIPRTL